MMMITWQYDGDNAMLRYQDGENITIQLNDGEHATKRLWNNDII